MADIQTHTGTNNSRERSITALLVLVLLAALFSGCALSTDSTIRELGKEEIIVKELNDDQKKLMRDEIISGLQAGVRNYTLNPGDVLEVMYHIDLIKLKTRYRIGVEDEVSVEFQYNPGLNRTVIVRPDGMITLPIKGDFDVGGETPEQAAKMIAKGYSDIIRDPVVTLSVNKFSSKIFALQKAITNSPRGQAKRIPVSPDGNLYLPLLDGIKAAGKSIDAVEAEIQSLYDKDFKNLEISLLLESITGRQIFIYGSVYSPGKIESEHPLTVAQALAQAGGVNPEGTMEHIKVLMIGENNVPVMRTVNLKRVIEEGYLEEDVLLPDNSVVFVPRTGTAKAGKWVDDYIRRILTWNGFSFQINYQLLNER